MSTSAQPLASHLARLFRRFIRPYLSSGVLHISLGALILLLDLFTGRFLLFPILFVIPVALSAWYCSPRLAYSLAILLPAGRLVIAAYLDVPAPFPFIVANGLIRVAVLSFIAFLVSRTARQTKELQQRVNSLVTICAWSRTVEYHGEWISFEQYLLRRFNINTSHSISPEATEKALIQLDEFEREASRSGNPSPPAPVASVPLPTPPVPPNLCP